MELVCREKSLAGCIGSDLTKLLIIGKYQVKQGGVSA